MERIINSDAALSAYLLEAQDKLEPGDGVAWGTNDCVTFVCGAVEAMTGDNPFQPYKGRYKSKIGAQRVLKRDFGGSLQNALSSVLGDALPAGMGGQGDIALSDGCCGVVMGKYALYLGPKGFMRLPTVQAECIFRV